MPKNGTRESKFIQNLALGLPIEQAALKAGYSASYSKTSVRRKLNNPKFISKLAEFADQLPETRTTLAKLRLPRLFQIEDDFYKECETDPELYAKYTKMSEREYRLAGLLKHDVQAQILVPVQVAIQVQNVFEGQEVSHKQGDTVLIENTDSKVKSDK